MTPALLALALALLGQGDFDVTLAPPGGVVPVGHRRPRRSRDDRRGAGGSRPPGRSL